MGIVATEQQIKMIWDCKLLLFSFASSKTIIIIAILLFLETGA